MILEEWVEIAKQLTVGLLERMGIDPDIEGSMKEGDIYLDVKSDDGGILIGKHGRTLESLQVVLNRMINRQVKESVRVVLDIADYKKRRADSLERMALRLGGSVKRTGRGVTIGPFSAHDRRIIHLTLKEDFSLGTEGIGEGNWKKLKIIPARKEE
jgi:spoIIIJ-associated protein